MDNREFDLVVYGASGFTGQYVALEVLKSCMRGKEIKWAVGGRNRQKLSELLKMLKDETGSTAVDKVESIEADISDADSLVAMCKRVKVVVNCVGPYRFYGEPVVKACVEAGTNYVDVSGEPEFLEKMQVEYHKQAEEKGIHIVGACGFDSVPADVGLEFLRDNFPGTLTSAECYINYYGRPKGNFGTYESMVHGVASQLKLKSNRKKIFTEKVTHAGTKLKRRTGIFFSDKEQKYTIPFLGADPSVVRRTQYFENRENGRVPIQFAAYFCMQSFLHLLGILLFGLILGLLSLFKAGRNLLLTYPKFFSLGVFSKDGLTRKEMDERSASLTFYGNGYSAEPDQGSKPDKSLTLRIRMPEPGYVATPIFVVQSALVLLHETLPNRGGVLTAGSAFRGTSMVQRLKDLGIDFQLGH